MRRPQGNLKRWPKVTKVWGFKQRKQKPNRQVMTELRELIEFHERCAAACGETPDDYVAKWPGPRGGLGTHLRLLAKELLLAWVPPRGKMPRRFRLLAPHLPDTPEGSN